MDYAVLHLMDMMKIHLSNTMNIREVQEMLPII